MSAATNTIQQEESRPDIFGAHIPSVHFCGIEPISSEPGRTRLRVKLEDHHMNQLGIAHGGVTMTLIDVALSAPPSHCHLCRFCAKSGALSIQ